MRSKKTLKNIICSLVQKIITIICAFIAPKLIIGTFGSNVHGLTTSITQFLGYITLLESGFGPVVTSALYKPIAQKNKQEIENILGATESFFRKIAYIFIVYVIVLVFIFPLLVNKDFDFMFTSSLVIIIAISTFAEYFFGMTYRLYINALQENYIISIIQIITTILNTIMIIILIKLHASIQIVKLLSAVIFIFRPILQNIYIKKKYKINLKNRDKNYKIKNKWDGLAQHIAAVVHNNTDVTVLTLLSTLSEVSVYSVHYLVVSGIKNMIMSFTGGAEASFGDMIAKNEIDNLNVKFSYYELFYYTIITIIYACTFILITPFISLYTSGISKIDYIRPLFAILLVASDYSHAIRLPYISLTYAAGHFKETMKGAWLESIINITLSIFLVFNFGIIGVAIGTLIAMCIRTYEFIFYTSKNVLYRNISKTINRIIVSFIEILIVFTISNIILKTILINTYFMFIVAGLICLFVSFIITVSINYVFFKNDFKGIKIIAQKIIKK